MPYSKLNNPHSGNHINAESTDDCQPIHTKMTDDILLNYTDGKAFEKSEELKRRKFFSKAHKPDTTPTATRSEARHRKGISVHRKRFQKGSVYLNRNKTVWMGAYSEYVLDGHGVEVRVRKQITLSPVKAGYTKTSKRDAMRLLQPHIDKVNGGTAQARRAITFDAFSEIWERDYLSQSKPATQSASRSYLKRLRAAFGMRDMRSITAGDVQRLVARSTAEGLSPKTIRLLWNTISQI